MPIHARHQFHPDRHWQRHADGTFKRDASGKRIPLRRHHGSGAPHMVMPPSLRDRRPALFDGWRTPESIARDADKAERKKWRTLLEAGRKAARDRRQSTTP